MAGQILRLTPGEGDTVRQGDTIAVIDHDLLRLQLRQVQAGAEAAEARLALLRRGARSEDIAGAQAAAEQVRVRHEQALADRRRIRTLFDSGSATQKQLDDAETGVAVAAAQLDAVLQNVNKLRNLARPEEIHAAEASVRQSVASGDVLRRQIADAFIVAPLSGVVTEKAAEAGEMAAPGMPLLAIVRTDPVYLKVYAPEPALGRIRLGQTVNVFTDSAPDRALRGRITFISPEAEFTPKNVQTKNERARLVYEIKIELPNPEGALKPGMYADAEIDLETPEAP